MKIKPVKINCYIGKTVKQIKKAIEYLPSRYDLLLGVFANINFVLLHFFMLMRFGQITIKLELFVF